MSFVWANEENHIPQFCRDNFPVLNPSSIEEVRSVAESGGTCDVNTHNGLRVSVPAEELIRFYSDIQEREYRSVAEIFKKKMREKVARSMVRSREQYMNLFPRMSCEHLSNYVFSSPRSDCEQRADIELTCGDPELQAAIEDEQRKVDEQYSLEAQALLQNFIEENNIDGENIVESDIAHAIHWQEEQKRAAFILNNMEAALKAHVLFDERRQAMELKERALERARNIRNRHDRSEALRMAERNHELVMQEIQVKISYIYEQFPTVFDIETTTSWILFQDSDYQISPFGSKLLEQVRELPGLDLSSMDTLVQFLSSDEGRIHLAEAAIHLKDDMPEEIAEAGREQVLDELHNSRQAMEDLCRNDGANLHHFGELAHEVLNDLGDDPTELLKNQAGYCYLAQRYPPNDGGLPTYMLIGAGIAIVGGIALQFIPGVGTAGGAAAIAYGLGVVGGGTFALDAYDRYSTAHSSDIAQQAVYQGNYLWTSAEEMRKSRDRLVTAGRVATLEVGLSVVDAAFFAFRPARQALIGAMRPSSVAPRVVAHSDDLAPAFSLTHALDESDTFIPPMTMAIDDIPVVRSAPELSPAAVDMAPPIISTSPLADFSALSRARRIEISEDLVLRLQRGEALSETEFAMLVMQRASYSDNVFSAGPQGLARDLRVATTRDEAIEVVEAFYRGKNSASSQNRLRELLRLVDEIHPPPPRLVSELPTTGLARVADDLPPSSLGGLDEVVTRTPPPQVLTAPVDADFIPPIPITVAARIDAITDLPIAPSLVRASDDVLPPTIGSAVDDTLPSLVREAPELAPPVAAVDDGPPIVLGTTIPSVVRRTQPPEIRIPRRAAIASAMPGLYGLSQLPRVEVPVTEEEEEEIAPTALLDIEVARETSLAHIELTGRATLSDGTIAENVSWVFEVVTDGLPEGREAPALESTDFHQVRAPRTSFAYQVRIKASVEGYEDAVTYEEISPLQLIVLLSQGELDDQGRVPVSAEVKIDDEIIPNAQLTFEWSRSDSESLSASDDSPHIVYVQRKVDDAFNVSVNVVRAEPFALTGQAESEIRPLDSGLVIDLTRVEGEPNKVRVKITGENGETLNASQMRVTWLEPQVSESDRERFSNPIPRNPQNITGSLDSTVTVGLYDYGYVLVAEASDGQRQGIDNILIPPCSMIEGAQCGVPEDEVLPETPWPTFAPQNPPMGFRPMPIPSPQFSIIPGFP